MQVDNIHLELILYRELKKIPTDREDYRNK